MDQKSGSNNDTTWLVYGTPSLLIILIVACMTKKYCCHKKEPKQTDTEELLIVKPQPQAAKKNDLPAKFASTTIFLLFRYLIDLKEEKIMPQVKEILEHKLIEIMNQITLLCAIDPKNDLTSFIMGMDNDMMKEVAAIMQPNIQYGPEVFLTYIFNHFEHKLRDHEKENEMDVGGQIDILGGISHKT